MKIGRVAVGLIILLVNSLALGKELRTLKVAVYDFPPHIFAGTLSPEAKGPGLDFARQYLAPKSEYDVQWVAAPFARVLQDLANKKVDMALFLAKTPEREKVIKFSKSFLYSTSSGIIVPKNSKLSKAQSLSEFRGRTLGHSMNSVTPDILAQNGIKIEALSGENVIQRNIEKIRSGRLDGIFVPTISNGRFMLKRNKADKDFVIFVIPSSTLYLHVAFRSDIDEKIYADIERRLALSREKYLELLREQGE